MQQEKKPNVNNAKNEKNNTIAAIATPLGTGGVGVIRVSGDGVYHIAEKILGSCPTPRVATFAKFKQSDQVLDEGLAIYFKKPNSFTGEDVLELQGHGGMVVLTRVLKAIIHAGARLAQPGEFSKRAFLNNKMDLTQAEAVADLIAAHSEQAAAGAMRSVQGEFKQKINTLVEKLIDVRKFIEAAMDFPEEEIDFLNDDNLKTQLVSVLSAVEVLQSQTQQGVILRQGIAAVIVGKPNAGKSSLLNALSQRDSAIVTDIPGTTRDILREWINLNGVPMHIIDTAGLRETENIIEMEGIKRTHNQIKQADLILLVVDSAEKDDIALQINKIKHTLEINKPILVVLNKIDCVGAKPEIIIGEQFNRVCLSAKYGHGIDLLKNYLLDFIGWTNSNEGVFVARTRHLTALSAAQQHLKNGIEQFYQHKAAELLAEDLKLAQQELSQITGEFSSDDLLGRIFSEFCIGK